MRNFILVVTFSVLFILINARSKCDGKKFNKTVKKYKKCRAQGYTSKIVGCTATTEDNLNTKQAKKCGKAEASLKKCGYTCTDPVDGGWTDFGDWSECSATCGGGSQSRSRSCTNPAPKHGGAECQGEDSENQNCNTQDCPVNGGWTGFGSWSECSAQCGGGSQSRKRYCTNPAPQNGGAYCAGQWTQNQNCNTQDCQTVLKAAWQGIPGKLTKISKGNSGIWGVNSGDKIFKLQGDGKSWNEIGGALRLVSSGATVWGVNKNDDIFKYINNGWQKIGGKLTNVDVSNKDHVWGVNRGQDIFRWTGSGWNQVGGKLIQISVGESGVWGVNSGHDIFYRQGTYGDANTAGTGWSQVSGKLQWISSGTNIVVGVNSGNEIFYRTGMTTNNPVGTGWIKVSGNLKLVDVNGNEVVGTQSGDSIFRSPVGPAK